MFSSFLVLTIVCIYVYMNTCMYVCVHVCTPACLYVSLSFCLYVCIHIPTHVTTYLYAHMHAIQPDTLEDTHKYKYIQT